MSRLALLVALAAPATVSASYFCIEEQCATEWSSSGPNPIPPAYLICKLAFDDAVVHEAYADQYDVPTVLAMCRDYCVEGSRAAYWDGANGSLWEICGSCHDPEIRQTMCNTFCADTVTTPSFCDNPPVVTDRCTFHAGDAVGGTEQRLGTAATPAACVDMVLAVYPDADGVTYGASSSCYAEWDITGISQTTAAGYRTCIFETLSPNPAPTTPAAPTPPPPTGSDAELTDPPTDPSPTDPPTFPPTFPPVNPPTADDDGSGDNSGAGDRVTVVDSEGNGNDLLGKHGHSHRGMGKSPRPDRPVHVLGAKGKKDGKKGKKGSVSLGRAFTPLQAGAGSAVLIALATAAVFTAYRKHKNRIQHLDDVESDLATFSYDNNDGGSLGKGKLDHEGSPQRPDKLNLDGENIPLLQAVAPQPTML